MQMYTEPKKDKDLPLASVKMKQSLVKKKIKKAKKGKIDATTLPDGGKGGALKSLKYFRDEYKKAPESPARKKHLEESLDFYKKKYMKGK